MEEQKKITKMGGTMRLGAYTCDLKPGSQASAIYNGASVISERHRHRYEFNNDFLEQMEQGAWSRPVKPGTGLVEMIELPGHPFFVGGQFHPELKSTVESPAPLFVSFIEAAKNFAENKNGKAKQAEEKVIHE